MLRTPIELQQELGKTMRIRRILQGWSQSEAAKRAGMGVSTWKRMESGGGGHIENLINAALALRCEETLEGIFPAPAASSIDDLLARQVAASTPDIPLRVRRRHKA
jgi:transcriptional regulator with XRE-family HTH domain